MRRHTGHADVVSAEWSADLWSSAAFDHGNLSRQRRLWSGVAIALLISGILGSIVTARSVATNDAQSERQDFERSSEEVVSTLELAIQHQDDLVINAERLRGR